MFELITILVLFVLCVFAVFLWQREVGKLYDVIDDQDDIINAMAHENNKLRGDALLKQADDFARDCGKE